MKFVRHVINFATGVPLAVSNWQTGRDCETVYGIMMHESSDSELHKK